MLSGIGDCNQLASFGIPCLVNLPGVRPDNKALHLSDSGVTANQYLFS